MRGYSDRRRQRMDGTRLLLLIVAVIVPDASGATFHCYTVIRVHFFHDFKLVFTNQSQIKQLTDNVTPFVKLCGLVGHLSSGHSNDHTLDGSSCCP